MISDSRDVSFMVSGLSVVELAVEAAAYSTHNLAAPIVLDDYPRAEWFSITVNVMDGVLALGAVIKAVPLAGNTQGPHK